jgi:ribonucleoside-diphosphate reductase alpha chain
MGKVEMQGKIQKWIDHSISVTVNVPEITTVETVNQIYLKAHEVECKGITVYREGSRSGVLISHKKEEKKESDNVVSNEANKRPETLICDIYNISRNKQAYTIIVGKIKDRPYEIFVLEKLENSEFPDKITQGEIKKIKSKVYMLKSVFNNKEYKIDNIVDYMNNDEQKDTRNFSLMLRSNIKSKDIIDQINEYASISSFHKVIAKVLSNYLNGEKVKGETQCPNCNSVNIRNESACFTCQDCGWSKCG